MTDQGKQDIEPLIRKDSSDPISRAVLGGDEVGQGGGIVDASSSLPIKLTSEFEGQSLTTIAYKGQLCWSAAEVGRLLGYNDNGSGLVTSITREWLKEIIEERDYHFLRGKELADFKALFQLPGKFAGSRAPHVMLLFEKGLYGVCLKTNKPIGVRLRDYIKTSVLPQLARDGAYLPNREVVNGKLVSTQPAQSTSLEKFDTAAFMQIVAQTAEHAAEKAAEKAVERTVPVVLDSWWTTHAGAPSNYSNVVGSGAGKWIRDSLREYVRDEIAPIKETQCLIQAELTEIKSRDSVKASVIGPQYGKQLRKRLVDIAREIAPHDKLEQHRQRSLIDYTLRTAIGHYGAGARWEELPTAKWPEALMELERIVRGSVGVPRHQLPLFGDLHVVPASSAGMR